MGCHDLAQLFLSRAPLHEGGATLAELFLRYESLMITAASWVIIQVAQKSATSIGNHPLFVRLKPAMPVFISVGMAYLPKFRLGTWDETLLYGIVLGSFTGFGQKLLKQTLLGQDARLAKEETTPTPLTASTPAVVVADDKQKQGRQRLREKIKHLIT